MIKDNIALVEIIKRKIIEEYEAFPYDFPMQYRLKWLGGKKVNILAWQEKYGSTINNVDFIVSMSKDLMRNQETEFLNVDKEFADWLYGKNIKEVKRMEVTEDIAIKAQKYKERYTSRLDRLETRAEDTKANIEEMKARVKVCEEAIEKYKDSHCKEDEVKE